MTYKPQSVQGKPDSVIKHQKFSDPMQRYHGQMESALYAAEITCGIQNDCPLNGCPFHISPTKEDPSYSCQLVTIREIIGDHVQQHDIEIPEDDTQAQRKANR
jgi:hypothetical protein